MSETTTEDQGPVIGGGQDQQSAKRKFDPGFSRNMRIVGGGLVVGVMTIVGVVYFFSGGNESLLPPSSKIQISGGTQASNDGLTPAMREKLARAQTQEAAMAARQGESYIPPDVLPTAPNEPMLTPEAQARATEAEVQANAQAVQAINERNQIRLAAAQQMLASALTRPDVERVSVQAEDVDAKAGNAGNGAASPAAPASAAQRDASMVVDMMEIFGARLSSPVDTDSSAFASAEITTGKLAGAYLIGQVRLAGEGVQFEFTGMRHKNVTYPINAIALDQTTSTSAVQGELDRKLLQRYVFPVLMAYTGAYATAKAQVPLTTTPLNSALPPSTSSDGQTIVLPSGYTDYGITRPSPTAPQARAAGVAAAVSAGNSVTSKLAAEPVRVSMPNGTSIGIMFRQPVLASSAAVR